MQDGPKEYIIPGRGVVNYSVVLLKDLIITVRWLEETHLQHLQLNTPAQPDAPSFNQRKCLPDNDEVCSILETDAENISSGISLASL